MTRLLSLSLVALFAATPLDAQQWQVAREQFAFAGRQLTVNVEVEVEGTLRIIRGAPGIVRVSGRTPDGITAAGLTAEEEITLTALAEGPVEYVVSVPGRVWVDVYLPDRVVVESIGTQQRTATYQWAVTEADAELEHDVRPPEPEGAGRMDQPDQHDQLGTSPAPVANDGGSPAPVANDARFTALADGTAPETVTIPDLNTVRSLTVRVEGPVFRVHTSRPMARLPGNARHIEIRPAQPPMDLVIMVPEGTTSFTLVTNGQEALTLNRGQVDVLCTPNTTQRLPDGQSWVTFNPVDGRLQCGTTVAKGGR